jgi:hypothetical protein
MTILMLTGVGATVYVWATFGPWWGLLAGFLAIGGLGFRVLALPVRLVLRILYPGWSEFVRAWEKCVEPVTADTQAHVMRAGYRTWRRDRSSTGDSAEEWLRGHRERFESEGQAERRAVSSAGRISGRGAFRGSTLSRQYEGEVFGTEEGLVVEGVSELSGEATLLVEWEHIKGVRRREAEDGAELLLDPLDDIGLASGLLFIEINGLTTSDEVKWLEFLKQHGVSSD